MDSFPMAIETLLEGKCTDAKWTLEPTASIVIIFCVILVILKVYMNAK